MVALMSATQLPTQRIAVITGAGRGIGRAIARRLAADGVIVVVSARTGAELNSLVDEVNDAGGRGLAVVADALTRDGARLPVERALADFGKVDIVVNNVGGSVGGNQDPFDGDESAFEQTLTLNLTSAFWTTKAALGSMRDNGWGRVISIGSGASKTSTKAGSLGYTTAKHGLVGFTRQLASAAAPFGITVNCVCPGWTNTSLVNWDAIAARRQITVEQAKQVAYDASVQGRILEPEELTPMISLLAGDDGRGITGQVISVDGGLGI